MIICLIAVKKSMEKQEKLFIAGTKFSQRDAFRESWSLKYLSQTAPIKVRLNDLKFDFIKIAMLLF